MTTTSSPCQSSLNWSSSILVTLYPSNPSPSSTYKVIFLLTPIIGIFTRAFLISAATGNKWEPDVFRDVVVWGDYRNGNWDIYGYNLATNNEFVIAAGPAYQRSVAIYGNTVVYEN